MAATVLIGVLMVIALVIGYDEIMHIWGVVIVGVVLALPLAYVLTNRISHIGDDNV